MSDEERKILDEIIETPETVELIPYTKYSGEGKKIRTDFDRGNNIKIDRYRLKDKLIDVATPWIAPPLEVGDLDLWGDACKKAVNLVYGEVKKIYEELEQDKIREKIKMSTLQEETKNSLLREYKEEMLNKKAALLREGGVGDEVRKEDARIPTYWSGKSVFSILRVILDRVEKRYYANVNEGLSVIKEDISEKKYEDLCDEFTKLGFSVTRG